MVKNVYGLEINTKQSSPGYFHIWELGCGMQMELPHLQNRRQEDCVGQVLTGKWERVEKVPLSKMNKSFPQHTFLLDSDIYTGLKKQFKSTLPTLLFNPEARSLIKWPPNTFTNEEQATVDLPCDKVILLCDFTL